MMRSYSKNIQYQIIAIIIIGFFGMFYFIAGMQMGTTVTLAIQQKIKMGLIHMAWPASTFSSLYPLFVLLLAPFITLLWRWLKKRNQIPHPLSKLAIALTLAAFSMGILSVFSLTSAMVTGVILGNLFMSAGEIILAPTIYTVISDLSPLGLKNTLMGGWFLFIGIGSYLSSILANTINSFSWHNKFYTQNFLITAIFIIIILNVFLIFKPKLARLMKGYSSTTSPTI